MSLHIICEHITITSEIVTSILQRILRKNSKLVSRLDKEFTVITQVGIRGLYYLKAHINSIPCMRLKQMIQYF
jgi:hypothetical protein